jgi:hypothetical protein
MFGKGNYVFADIAVILIFEFYILTEPLHISTDIKYVIEI